MTVIESDDTKDRYGRYPLIFKGYKDIREVYTWLYDHYYGYEFVVVFNCTTDEIDPELSTSKDLYVYFADEALDEMCYYAYDVPAKALHKAYERLKETEKECQK